jgi:lysozyme
MITNEQLLIMNISSNGLQLIESFEGFKSSPYLDIGGIPTIGIGSTYYEDGTSVTMDDSPITMVKALDLLQNALQSFEQVLNEVITVNVTQNQYDTLCSFIYNIGAANFKTSTLLKKLNLGDIDGASEEFLKWDKVAGVTSQGLLNRRTKEKELFETSQ